MNNEPEGVSPKKLGEAVGAVSEACGLRKDFLADLLFLEPNDWSFVIKAHALAESVVCQLLAAHLHQPSMEYVLAQRVQMEDRIEMLKAINICDSDDRRMLRLLGKLRNNLVHNVKQTEFKFSDYLRNKDNRHNFVEAFGTRWSDPVRGNPPIARADYVIQNPRYAIWVSLMHIVMITLKAKLDAHRREVVEALRREMFKGAIAAGTDLGDKPPDGETSSS